jgi:Zn-dependent protease
MDPYNLIIKICVNAIPLILAITLHEAAHGYVARLFGDNTAYILGRVTLNPAKHIDPIGTIAFPLLSMALGGVFFGWAKPVPVNFGNLRRPKQDMLWVAAAGPLSNAVQALLWAAVAKAIDSLDSPSGVAQFWFAVSLAGVGWNVVIAIFNLFPILPLDGGHIVWAVLDWVRKKPVSVVAMERSAMVGLALILVLVVLVMSSDLSKLQDGGLNVR